MADPVRQPSEVVIVGAGFAGALLALVLARRGHAVQVVDLHEVHPPEFRCEKLGLDQARALHELDALAPIAAHAGLADATPAAIARVGLFYAEMVNALRDAWPDTVAFHQGRVVSTETGEDHQVVQLSTGERLEGRLLVLATGRGERLRRSLGIHRRTLRERHSLCIGFSLEAGEGRPPLSPMVAHGGRGGDGLGFASLFPIGEAARVNLFCYRDPGEAWTRSFRQDPLAALTASFPELSLSLEEARVIGAAEFGVIDLYRCEGFVRPGVVLIGDAYASSCPATAMGLTRVITDVRQLAFHHAPAWLTTPGMGAGKIAAFYADPMKRRMDRLSRRRAELGRFEATDRGPAGGAVRLARRLRRSLALRAAA
jgi:2-polyprenyl-6-methoxyphenol hydroxylase-like FAD-dependent oxidoreductase